MEKHKLTNIDGHKISVKNHIFTWSNLLSFIRLVIVLPIIYLHIENDYQVDFLIMFLILFGLFTDFLDGWVARKFDEISELGKVLDPVADKLMAFFLFGYTVWLGWIPVWYFALGVSRDLLIIAGSAYIKRIRGKVAMAVMSGKVSVNLMAVYWISVFFYPPHAVTDQILMVQQILLILSVLLMVISFIHYAYRFNEIRKGAEFN